MNKATKILATLALAACSTAPQSSLTSDVDLESTIVPNWGTDQVVKLSRDDRPVDGDFTEITFLLYQGRYVTTQKVIPGGLHPDPQPTPSDIFVSSKLTCENDIAAKTGELNGFYCSHDARPVDGALVELTATKSTYGSGFDVSMTVTSSGFGTGNTDPVTTELGYNLEVSVGFNPVPAKLHCIDTATFADAPGEEAQIRIDQRFLDARINTRPVRLRGQDEQPWQRLNGSFSVDLAGDDILTITEQKDTNVDWDAHGMCYKFVPTIQYQVQKLANGNWMGERTILPIILQDPAVDSCSMPRLARPVPVRISCSPF